VPPINIRFGTARSQNSWEKLSKARVYVSEDDYSDTNIDMINEEDIEEIDLTEESEEDDEETSDVIPEDPSYPELAPLPFPITVDDRFVVGNSYLSDEDEMPVRFYMKLVNEFPSRLVLTAYGTGARGSFYHYSAIITKLISIYGAHSLKVVFQRMQDKNLYQEILVYIEPIRTLAFFSNFKYSDNENWEISKTETLIPANTLLVNSITFYHPIMENAAIKDIRGMVMDTTANERSDSSAFVNMIAKDRYGDFTVKRLTLNNFSDTLIEPDLHYGEGFGEFSEELITKLVKHEKGLFLLYGHPGTGKTFYIKHVLSRLTKEERRVLLIPSDIINNIMEPGMLTFISSWAKEQDDSVTLLIEDAEDLLKNRVDGRTGAISNLLNMTDGILNDVVKLKVLATFNMPDTEIDEALLRSGRLVARKEFKAFSKEQAARLIEFLGIDMEARDGLSVADIYAHKDQYSIIEHTTATPEKAPMGFGS
jgi:hypothetical protein